MTRLGSVPAWIDRQYKSSSRTKIRLIYILLYVLMVKLTYIFIRQELYAFHVLTQPLCNTWSNFYVVLQDLNSEFSFSWTYCHIKIKELSLPYYLPIVEEIIVGSIPFPKVLALYEMQTASFRFQTRVAVSIS